jgi:hypothetical protein
MFVMILESSEDAAVVVLIGLSLSIVLLNHLTCVLLIMIGAELPRLEKLSV